MKNLINRCKKWIPIGKVPEISPKDLHQKLTSTESIQLIDVRTQLEWQRAHIQSAVSFPILGLGKKVSDLPFDKSKPIVAICLSAHRSIPAVRLLKQAGYQDVMQLEGGMRAWNRQFPNQVVTANL